jgi:hypothetical protein
MGVAYLVVIGLMFFNPALRSMDRSMCGGL